MIIVTREEVEQYRTELADEASALSALDMLEDCEGNLEDAAIALGLRVGQEPDRSEDWLDGLAKRWRAFVCQTGIKESLQSGSIATAVKLLAAESTMPDVLALPVVLYVVKTGVEEFCKPLQEKL
ncbi:hypothetical protein [Thermocoleostomius sinensis]|jgi:hypothetical protein|uniref:Uncharacterized protein n=1 Tax=Thermocoleostomius sinensis A174 TaxID=2016057 RepID=A0A9E8ZCD3_9CYAN|nr:hypothetical protein [Thermocoleostomius sinensis]WAL60553.1 hypothetical protein OXH18_00730 [Thermocoleostomius sinensis A174]